MKEEQVSHAKVPIHPSSEGPPAAPRPAAIDRGESLPALPFTGPCHRVRDGIAQELQALCLLVRLLGDDDVDEDEIVEWLMVLAPTVSLAEGKERAWILRTVLRLLDADAGRRSGHRKERELPALRDRTIVLRREPGIDVQALERVHGALAGLDRPTRAAVLLVLHEGLSIEEAVLVQGGTKGAFAKRYAEGLSSLGDELIDVVLGRFLA